MRISDWRSDVCSSDRRVRCLVAAVNGIALRRAGEIDDGDRERGFAFRTAEPLESVPAVETQTLRSRIGQTDVLDRHARDAPCEIRRIDAAVEHACKRSEEHTSELQSLMRISYAVFCWKKKKEHTQNKCNTSK